jgi:Tol biopolymer transport system component
MVSFSLRWSSHIIFEPKVRIRGKIMVPKRLGVVFAILFLLTIACNFSGTEQTTVPTLTRTEAPTSGPEPTPIVLPTEVDTPAFQLAYIGGDGNVWFRLGPDASPLQITTDGSPGTSGGNTGPSITYSHPAISDDSTWVAFQSYVRTPIESGMEFEYGLWIHNMTTGENRQILEEMPVGLVWKPGTHLLTYGLSVADAYFAGARGVPDASLAEGILTYDADSGEWGELVSPELGYSLVNPRWSLSGRFLGFDEVAFYEGRGTFAYYDFGQGMYIAWEEAIGNYAWSPDETKIYYDRLTYVASGTEEIFSRSFPEGSEEQITKYTSEFEYAILPTTSPDGNRIAYLASLDGPDDEIFQLMVQDIGTGKTHSLGTFANVYYLIWSPDGERLFFSAGPWDGQNLLVVNADDGAVWNSGPGTMPSVAGG